MKNPGNLTPLKALDELRSLERVRLLTDTNSPIRWAIERATNALADHVAHGIRAARRRRGRR